MKAFATQRHALGALRPLAALLAAACIAPATAAGADGLLPPVPAARYAQTTLTLPMVELYARELPANLRLPRIGASKAWLDYICRSLCARDVLAAAAAETTPSATAAAAERERFARQTMSALITRQRVHDRIRVTDEEVETYYHTHPQDFGTTSQFSVRIMRTKDPAKTAEVARRLSAGDSFESAEQTLSDMSPRVRGRILGPYPVPGAPARSRLAEPLFNAAVSVPQGGLTAPVKIDDWHYLLQVVERRPATPLPLDSVRSQIRHSLVQIKAQAGEQELLKELRAKWKNNAGTSEPAGVRQEKPTSATVAAAAATSAGVAAASRALPPSREELLAEEALRAGIDRSPDFRVAMAFRDLAASSAAAIRKQTGTAGIELSDDQVTSYLRALRAVPGPDGYSISQRVRARELLTDEAQAIAETEAMTAAVARSAFAMRDSTARLPQTAHEAAQAALKAAGAGNWEIDRVESAAPDVSEAPSAPPPTFAGQSGLIPSVSLPLQLVGRSNRWKVRLASRATKQTREYVVSDGKPAPAAPAKNPR